MLLFDFVLSIGEVLGCVHPSAGVLLVRTSPCVLFGPCTVCLHVPWLAKLHRFIALLALVPCDGRQHACIERTRLKQRMTLHRRSRTGFPHCEGTHTHRHRVEWSV